MKVSKRFRWEGSHRLLIHNGDCKNLHGHSYIMFVEFNGNQLSDMLIDFGEIKKIISPLIQSWDHATLVFKNDTMLIEAMKMLNSKHYILPYESTSENICRYVIEFIILNANDLLRKAKIMSIIIRVQETDTCYAELEYFFT